MLLFKKLFNRKSRYGLPRMGPQYSTGSHVSGDWDYSYHSLTKESYVRNVIAFRSVSTIASAVGSVEVILERDGAYGRERVFQHPLLDLMRNPNREMSGRDLISNIVSHQLLNGNAYVVKVSAEDGPCAVPSELYLLRPDRVEIKPIDDSLLRYIYKVNGRTLNDYRVDLSSYCSDLLHIKNYHPLDDLYGMANAEAAFNSIEQHTQAIIWNQSLLRNGARPSGAIVTRGNKDGAGEYLTEEQYNRLKTQLEDLYSGSSNAGKTFILEGGLDWKEMSSSPKDMDFVKIKDGAARDIALAFGVPPQLLGIPGDNTYSNLVEARLALWEDTVLPMLDRVLERLNNWLVPLYGGDLTLSYNIDDISALSAKREKVWNALNGVSFMTINEKRSMFGLPHIEGGDRLE